MPNKYIDTHLSIQFALGFIRWDVISIDISLNREDMYNLLGLYIAGGEI